LREQLYHLQNTKQQAHSQLDNNGNTSIDICGSKATGI